MQRRAHAHRGEIRRPVAAGAHLVQRRQVGDAAQVRDAAGVDDGGADVVDELLLDQALAVPDGIEDLAHGQRRGRVLADQAEGVLVLGRGRVLDPEQAVGLELAAQARGLDGCEAVVHVVQQVVLPAQLGAHGLEQARHVAQVLAGVPVVLGRQAAVGGLVEGVPAADAVDLLQPGHAALRADGLVAELGVAQHLVDRLLDVAAVGVAVDHDAAAARATQHLVQRQAGGLGLQVPQRGVDGRDRAHRHRPAPPVGAAVEVVPDVLELVRVAPDQAGHDVVLQVARHRELASVERAVAQPGQAGVGLDLQRDEVAAGAADDDLGGGDLHGAGPVGAGRVMEVRFPWVGQGRALPEIVGRSAGTAAAGCGRSVACGEQQATPGARGAAFRRRMLARQRCASHHAVRAGWPAPCPEPACRGRRRWR